MKISEKFKNNLVNYSIYIILIFIVVSSLLSFWNRYVTYETKSTIESCERVNQLLERIEYEIINEIDRGLNRFLITKNFNDLQIYEKARQKKDMAFEEIENELTTQQYPLDEIKTVEKKLNEFISFSDKTINRAQNDSIFQKNASAHVSPLNDLKNYFTNTSGKLIRFEQKLELQSKYDYDWSITDNAIIQIILILLSFPILIITLKKLKKEVEARQAILKELDHSNKKYLFDDGQETIITAQHVVEKSILNLQKAFAFVEAISKKNYQFATNYFNDLDAKRNSETLMGALIRMGGQLQKVDEEENRRKWISEGLNQFSEIVRKHQQNTSLLAEKVTSFLTKYLNSHQGSLFIYIDNQGDDYLEMAACFAFNKKKWIEKRVGLGSGLVGQTFLEKQFVLLTNIPPDYISITSGLGNANPTCLLIVPMKYNDEVEAVFEVAGFNTYLPHEINFLEKAGEYVAAALQSSKSSKQNEDLLKQSLEQSEMLKAQEEELLQNLEEMQATQEEMKRKENDLNERLEKIKQESNF